MERRDESIVWDQYAPYVAADGSFLACSQTQLFQKLRHASPDGSSGALGDDSQGSLGTVSDPCMNQNLNASVSTCLPDYRQLDRHLLRASVFAAQLRARAKRGCSGLC